jgi:2-hydroxychromene-2-carboxylate isomerase
MAPAKDVTVEFYFDCSSPWTYLGFHQLTKIAVRLGVEIQYKPIVVGFIFNEVNRVLYETRANPPVPRKAEYSMKDMKDWALLGGLTLNFPPKCGHPVNAVKVMRACVAVEALGKLHAFATAAFEELWVHGRDIGKEEVIADVCGKVGVDAAWVLKEMNSDHVKATLKANTDAVIARGGFGSPTVYVNGTDMYFGNDRVVLVEAAIVRARKKRAEERGIVARM